MVRQPRQRTVEVGFGVGKSVSAGAKALFKRLAHIAEQARVAKVWKAANEKPYVGNPDEIACFSSAQAAAAGAGADNVVNGLRLGQQLARESAESAFTSSGRLSQGAIGESRQIISGSKLGNKDLIQRLTSDGSSIADWGKYATRTYQSPSGDFQALFYMNRGTGAIDYDYKAIFNGVPR
jgi:hypothetical protein